MPYYCNPDGTATTLCVGDEATLLDGTVEMVPTRLMTQLVAEGVLAEFNTPVSRDPVVTPPAAPAASSPKKLGRPPGRPKQK